MSKSQAIRKEGAILYGQAFQSQELPPAVRVDRAKEAIRQFMEARKVAFTEGGAEDWVYATKNYGMASCMLASRAEYAERLGSDAVYFHFKDGLSFLIEAYVNGRKLNLATEWYAKLESTLLKVVDWVVEYAINQSDDWRHRCAKISQLLPNAQASDSTVANLHLKMAREVLKYVVGCSERADSRGALSALHEMYQSINFARQHLQRIPDQARPAELVEQLNDLEHSQRRYLCRVTSTQSREQAESLEDELLLENEHLNMDLAMIVLDHYSQAILASRSIYDAEACLESEAMATAGIGAFHHGVLKNEQRGHEYLFHAIQLADTISHTGGGVFFDKPWYQKAKALVEEFRVKRLAFDQSAIAEKRAPTLEKLKPQLDAMKASMAAFSGKPYRFYALLEHVYKEHPPKNDKVFPAGLDKDDNAALKKACLATVTYYHTDKSHNKSAGIEWYILCEEIIKELNGFYEYFKAV